MLSNVLHVPAMKKNLLSISQFTKEHDCIFEFSLKGFTVSRRPTRRVIARDSRNGGFYVLDQVKEVALFLNRQVDASAEVWHKRLGHYSSQVPNKLQREGLIHVNSKSKEAPVCSSCQLAKSHKLPFVRSSQNTLQLLEEFIVICRDMLL